MIMKFVAQRVLGAALSVNGQLVSEIGRGLVVFLGIKVGDSGEQAQKCAEKIANLRVFEDETGKMNRSVRDVCGEVLLVSQFTLYGDVRKGNRPSFTEAARAEYASALCELAAQLLSAQGIPTKCGVFGADMKIMQQNDGPVTIIYEI